MRSVFTHSCSYLSGCYGGFINHYDGISFPAATKLFTRICTLLCLLYLLQCTDNEQWLKWNWVSISSGKGLLQVCRMRHVNRCSKQLLPWEKKPPPFFPVSKYETDNSGIPLCWRSVSTLSATQKIQSAFVCKGKQFQFLHRLSRLCGFAFRDRCQESREAFCGYCIHN